VHALVTDRSRDSLSPRVALSAIVVVAAALRFGTLAAKSYWSDEGLTIADVRGSFGHMLHLVATYESSPPLFFLGQWEWSKTFGLSEVGTRSFSALLGTLTVPVVFAIARRLLSDRSRSTSSAPGRRSTRPSNGAPWLTPCARRQRTS
jgi:uncharacterized membrane protein